MGSRSKYDQTKEEEDDNKDGTLTGTDVAIGAAVGLGALAAWGISKWLGGSSDPQPKQQGQVIMESMSSSSWANSSMPRDHYNYEGKPSMHQTWVQFQADEKEQKLQWQKPRRGWYKLNTDGSARTEQGDTTGPATAGGLIRDHQGEWAFGFTAKLQDCGAQSAELQGLQIGLQLAWDRGYYEKLEVEIDSDAAVRLIKNEDLDLEKNPRVRECRKLLKQLGVRINPSINRSQNRCADALAKVPIPQGCCSPHVWDNVSDLPSTHRKNFQRVYLDEYEAGSVAKTQPYTYRLA